jgi:hypothetical protein
MLLKLNNTLRRIRGLNHSTVVVRDFNLYYPRWGGPKARPNCRVVVEYLIKVIENNKLKLSFKTGLIIRLAKGVGINPLTINLSLVTPNIANYLI